MCKVQPPAEGLPAGLSFSVCEVGGNMEATSSKTGEWIPCNAAPNGPGDEMHGVRVPTAPLGHQDLECILASVLRPFDRRTNRELPGEMASATTFEYEEGAGTQAGGDGEAGALRPEAAVETFWATTFNGGAWPASERHLGLLGSAWTDRGVILAERRRF